jgi:tRNA1(Val) A37 N6-methylase TrmN6
MTARTGGVGEVTHDTLLRGRVHLVQPVRGFRSSLDPVLLAGFVGPVGGRFLDIGCGTGALSFLLLARDAGARGAGVEIQPRLAACARAGCTRSGFDLRFALEEGDVRAMALPAAAFDLVVTNPPFHPRGAGALPPDPERATAHHEVTLALDEWLAVAARVTRPDGRLAAIYPAERAAELLAGMLARGFTPARLRPIYAGPGSGGPGEVGAASRVLVEGRRGGVRPLVIEEPLFVRGREGYSPEVKSLLGEGESGADVADERKGE